MRRDGNDQSVLLSLLDRLKDPQPKEIRRLIRERRISWRPPEPDEEEEGVETHPVFGSGSQEELESSVLENLEWVLNSRQVARRRPDLKLLNRSVYVYGLHDFSQHFQRQQAARSRLGRGPAISQEQELKDAIREAVEIFEPRLKNVTVTAADTSGSSTARWLFRIEAELRTSPAREIAFRTELQSGGKCRVSRDRLDDRELEGE